MLPLERFNAVWRPNEPERLKPVYVERVTIREALQGDLLPSLFGIVQLIEPTFGVRPGPSHPWHVQQWLKPNLQHACDSYQGSARQRWSAVCFTVRKVYLCQVSVCAWL